MNKTFSFGNKMTRALLCLSLAASAFCQRPSFGIKAGVPAADAFRSGAWRQIRYQGDSGRYVIGPAFELRLPLRLSIGLDVLRRSLKYRAEAVGFEATTTGDAWYFPLFAKYRLSDSWVAPFLAGGFAFERLSGIKQVGRIISGTLPRQEAPFSTDQPNELVNRNAYGYLLSAGLEGKLAVLRICPEIRYTRWQRDTFLGGGNEFAVSRRNQLEVLVGIMF